MLVGCALRCVHGASGLLDTIPREKTAMSGWVTQRGAGRGELEGQFVVLCCHVLPAGAVVRRGPSGLVNPSPALPRPLRTPFPSPAERPSRAWSVPTNLSTPLHTLHTNSTHSTTLSLFKQSTHSISTSHPLQTTSTTTTTNHVIPHDVARTGPLTQRLPWPQAS